MTRAAPGRIPSGALEHGRERPGRQEMKGTPHNRTFREQEGHLCHLVRKEFQHRVANCKRWEKNKKIQKKMMLH